MSDEGVMRAVGMGRNSSGREKGGDSLRNEGVTDEGMSGWREIDERVMDGGTVEGMTVGR